LSGKYRFPCDDRFVFTSPVDAFPANPWGFHDMLGNVRQWTSDCVHNTGYHGAPSDGRSWEDGGDCSNRMVRGGSWTGSPWAVRASFRGSEESGSRYAHTGIRVARDD
jgi:formylglycine-generating enzyme required for sulfatase activity